MPVGAVGERAAPRRDPLRHLLLHDRAARRDAARLLRAGARARTRRSLPSASCVAPVGPVQSGCDRGCAARARTSRSRTVPSPSRRLCRGRTGAGAGRCARRVCGCRRCVVVHRRGRALRRASVAAGTARGHRRVPRRRAVDGRAEDRRARARPRRRRVRGAVRDDHTLALGLVRLAAPSVPVLGCFAQRRRGTDV